MANIKQTKHRTESEARIAARALGNARVYIVESIEGAWGTLPRVPCFWVESGPDADGFVRNWERLVYSGPGRKA
jgi:hypothetical protein